MSQDPFRPHNVGRGGAKVRDLNRLRNRAPEEFARVLQIREMQKQRRGELWRRLFRRGT